MGYLALCCIARDEDHFLKEWLAYHALLGVEHFYIYDHCSRTPVRQVLGAFADSSRVTIRRIMGERMQLPAYDDCLRSFGAEWRWIGFLDLDEFVCPMRDDDLRVLLAEFEPYGGFAPTWHLFGSGGHLKRPEGPVIRNYSEAFIRQESYQTKCFVQPARTIQALSPHHFRYQPGFFCANEDHYPVSPGSHCTFSSGGLARINHYFVRSQQDFEVKISRGRADTNDPAQAHGMLMFYSSVEEPCAEDRAIQRFLPRLEAALQKDVLPKALFVPAPEMPYAELMEAAMALHASGQFAQAAALLCVGALRHEHKADLWTLRALIAQASGQMERADVFIRQSLMRESSREGYEQLRALFRARGQTRSAEGVEVILRRYPEFFS